MSSVSLYHCLLQQRLRYSWHGQRWHCGHNWWGQHQRKGVRVQCPGMAGGSPASQHRENLPRLHRLRVRREEGEIIWAKCGIFTLKSVEDAPCYRRSEWWWCQTRLHWDLDNGSYTRRPMSIFLIFWNTPLSKQVFHKVEVFWVKKIVEAKNSGVPFLSNCNFKKIIWCFLGFYNVNTALN